MTNGTLGGAVQQSEEAETNGTLGGAVQRGEEAETFALPDLQEAMFEPEQLTRYVEELCATGVAVEVSIKGTARDKAEPEVTLVRLLSKFLCQKLHSAQLRYALGGSRWVDTLISTPEGFRLVRMQQ